MGRTLTEWTTRVGTMLRDVAYVDQSADTIVAVGVRPALTQFAIDHPRETAIDVPSAGRYVPFPTAAQGWDEGMSIVTAIEIPAGQTPPAVLQPAYWQQVRDPATPSISRMMVPDEHAGQTARLIFNARWPIPDSNPATDLLGDAAFDAVCSLAAALVLTSAAAEASRDRMGAIPSDFTDGTDRARDLLDTAAAYRVIYNTFVGLGSVGGVAGTGSRTLRSNAVGSASKRLRTVDPYRYV